LKSRWPKTKIGATKEAIESDAIEMTATAAKTARDTTALTVQPTIGGILRDPGNVAVTGTTSHATATMMGIGTSVRVTLPTKATSTTTSASTDTRGKENPLLPNQ
jgi:hypothetical protein